MFINPLKKLLTDRQPAIGHWISLPSPSVVELLASYSPDWLMLDTEHGPASWETLEDMLRALKGTGVVPLVRVRMNDAGLIKQALDRGAYGVLVPLVHTADDAAAAVSAAMYPPEGIRGVAGSRVTRFGQDLPAYFASWNREVVVGVQIESAAALENVDAIAATPGVDILFVGPNDLSASLGVFRQFDHPAYVDAVNRVLRACQHHGVCAGYLASGPEEALKRVDQGFGFVGAGSDARLLGAAMAQCYQVIRSGLRERSERSRVARA